MSVDDAIDALDRHMTDGRPTGGFVYAVLCNDLAAAVGHADDQSLTHLHAIVAHCVFKLPAPSWGSPVKVAAWRAARMQEREAIP